MLRGYQVRGDKKMGKKKKMRVWRSKEKKDNDVEIIISGSQGQMIAVELQSALRRMQRKQEVSYYMTVRK